MSTGNVINSTAVPGFSYPTAQIQISTMNNLIHQLPVDNNFENSYKSNDDINMINLTSQEIRLRISQAYKIIKTYYEILDCEIVQFFNRNYWNLLPQSWCDFLMTLTIDKLALFMDVDNESGDFNAYSIPETLAEVRDDIRLLSLNRKNMKYHRLAMIHPESDASFDDFKRIYIRETSKFPFYQNLLSFNKKEPPLSLLKYKCKDKKLAEIVIMGDLCFKASLKRNIDFIVDIGAGLGHLSRCLAHFYNIDVVTIEKEEKMTKEAIRLDAKFIKLQNYHTRKNPSYNTNTHTLSAKIKRISAEITPEITPQEFLVLLSQSPTSTTKNFQFGLVGLHPCGNLAPTMLRLYKDCKNCQFINIASCCYNKMAIRDDYKDNLDGFIGFPMNKLESDLDVNLGKNQLGLALHALEAHQDRFRHDIGSFKADFYRAMVEKFIQDVAPEYADKRRKNVKTVGPGGVVNFKEYLQHSIPDYLHTLRADGEFKMLEVEGMDEAVEFRKILAFSALRHMFAPLLETVVLLDRLLYLKEDSTHCYLAQRFEPKVSPRVHVITAFK